MTSIQTENDTVLFSKKFGLITDKQLIINQGAKISKINFSAIYKVNLIKRRVFYFNITLFLLSLAVFAYTYFYLKSEKVEMYYSLLFIGIVIMIYSIIHKFYDYRIVIMEKDNSSHEIHTTQLHRKSIKEFYTSIIKRIPKKTKEY